MPEVEQHELGGALDQWRDAVKSVAAAAALQVGVAEQHLLAAVGRWVAHSPLLGNLLPQGWGGREVESELAPHGPRFARCPLPALLQGA